MRPLPAPSLAAALLLAFLPTIAPLAQPLPGPTDLDSDYAEGIAGPLPPGSEVPEVIALSSIGSLLVDRSHGEDFNVAGLTGFLQSEGWTIGALGTRPITESMLSGWDVFMVPVRLTAPILAFSSAEVASISNYLSQGGGLWLFHEFDQNPSGINSLSASFGVSFYQDRISDATNNEGHVLSPTIHLLEGHRITEGVSSYGYYAGCCLSVNPPGATIGRGDDDAFSSNCASYPATLAVYESTGRIVFSGDMTPLHPSYYPELLRSEEELLLQNIVNWLAQKPTTATGATSWGSIKALYR
jgi:hypothetical protein